MRFSFFFFKKKQTLSELKLLPIFLEGQGKWGGKGLSIALVGNPFKVQAVLLQLIPFLLPIFPQDPCYTSLCLCAKRKKASPKTHPVWFGKWEKNTHSGFEHLGTIHKNAQSPPAAHVTQWSWMQKSVRKAGACAESQSSAGEDRAHLHRHSSPGAEKELSPKSSLPASLHRSHHTSGSTVG